MAQQVRKLIGRGINLIVQDLGLTNFSEVWELQRKLQSELIAGTGEDHLILCEHTPVITIGRSAKKSATEYQNLLVDRGELQRAGIEIFEIERGGDITYHGPGQLVGYPVLNLSSRRKDVGWYMRSLEEIIIQTMRDFGLNGIRISGRTGVWVSETLKIASIGIRISRWCTMHGFSLNLFDQSAGFSYINPCGFSAVKMTSFEELLGRKPDNLLIKSNLIGHFRELLDQAASGRKTA